MIRPDEYFVLFSCGLCVVMALGLFFRPITTRNVLLALVLLCLGYIQLTSILFTSHLIYAVPHIIFTPLPFGYAISPLLFLYVKSFMNEKQGVTRIEFLHFVPVLIITGITIFYMSQSAEEKLQVIDDIYRGISLYSMLAVISMTAFLTYTIILITKVVRIFHKENPVHVRLLKVFLLFMSWFVLVLLKMIGLAVDLEYLWRIVNFIIGCEIILLYIYMQKMPVMLCCANITVEKPNERSRSILNSIDTDTLQREIELMMEEEKLFCDEDLSLQRLSHALEITPHQLSAFLNEYYEKNFNAFINGYRVRYACSLLDADPEASTLSVAFASGFNSYSAFFSAFKKEMSTSPGNYKSAALTEKNGS